MDVVLQHDLLCRMIEAHRGQPASIGQGPGANSAVDPVMAQQKALQMLPRLGQYPTAVARARTRSRIASCAASGIQIGVSSPARCSLASISASRRSVLTRSPAFIGISDGATTTQSCPYPVSKRCKPVSARAGLVAEARRRRPLASRATSLAQNLGTVLENANLPYLAAAAALGNRHRTVALCTSSPTYVISFIRPVPHA